MNKTANHKNKVKSYSKRRQRHKKTMRINNKRRHINTRSSKSLRIKHAKASSLSREKRGSERALAYRYSVRRAIAGGSKKKHIKGGSVNGPIGYGWNGGDIETWPGVKSSLGMNTYGTTVSNHFSVSPNGIVVGGIDPARSTSDDMIMKSSMNGGKQETQVKHKKSKQRGGFFQEIVNIGRGAQAGLNSGYFNLIGKQQPISQNPYPTQDQLLDTSNNISTSNNINTANNESGIRNIYVEANNSVANA